MLIKILIFTRVGLTKSATTAPLRTSPRTGSGLTRVIGFVHTLADFCQQSFCLLQIPIIRLMASLSASRIYISALNGISFSLGKVALILKQYGDIAQRHGHIRLVGGGGVGGQPSGNLKASAYSFAAWGKSFMTMWRLPKLFSVSAKSGS